MMEHPLFAPYKPYDFGMRTPLPPALPIDTTLLKPGLRLAVGVSGGADSVALLRALAERAGSLGLVLHVAHLHHGLRGPEADGDQLFARTLAAELGLPFHEARVDTAAEARSNPGTGKPTESIEEAARRLRYAWFRQLLASGAVDAVATAHTLDDQAETVLAKFLRGAWTEGLSGIHPKIQFPEGPVLRPLLGATRAQVEAYLHSLSQDWREDSSNRHLTFTRNRIRHELLPLLETWNPQLREHLSQMAELARDEEVWWQEELARVAPQLILTGRAVRGGGRASDGDGLSIDVTRLNGLPPALQRRLLRHAAELLGAAPDFAATEELRALALTGRAGQKREFANGLRAERTPRELRLTVGSAMAEATASEYTCTIPGEILAPSFGLRLQLRLLHTNSAESPDENGAFPTRHAILRNWKPGDQVRLRYSSGPRKVKEVLERLRVTGTDRALWPVLEVNGRVAWMKGVELEPEQGIEVMDSALDSGGHPSLLNEGKVEL
jgi:tRNA(Ile)-lysidine synthase